MILSPLLSRKHWFAEILNACLRSLGSAVSQWQQQQIFIPCIIIITLHVEVIYSPLFYFNLIHVLFMTRVNPGPFHHYYCYTFYSISFFILFAHRCDFILMVISRMFCWEPDDWGVLVQTGNSIQSDLSFNTKQNTLSMESHSRTRPLCVSPAARLLSSLPLCDAASETHTAHRVARLKPQTKRKSPPCSERQEFGLICVRDLFPLCLHRLTPYSPCWA